MCICYCGIYSDMLTSRSNFRIKFYQNPVSLLSILGNSLPSKYYCLKEPRLQVVRYYGPEHDANSLPEVDLGGVVRRRAAPFVALIIDERAFFLHTLHQLILFLEGLVQPLVETGFVLGQLGHVNATNVNAQNTTRVFFGQHVEDRQVTFLAVIDGQVIKVRDFATQSLDHSNESLVDV